MRAVATHLLADLLVWLSVSAPVPRERPAVAADFAGRWEYRWAGTPGVLWFGADGSYRALHGDALSGYAGVWWLDRGRVILTEYPTCADGAQRGLPVRYEFAAARTAGGYELRGNVTVTLTRGGD